MQRNEALTELKINTADPTTTEKDSKNENERQENKQGKLDNKK